MSAKISKKPRSDQGGIDSTEAALARLFRVEPEELAKVVRPTSRRSGNRGRRYKTPQTDTSPNRLTKSEQAIERARKIREDALQRQTAERERKLAERKAAMDNALAALRELNAKAEAENRRKQAAAVRAKLAALSTDQDVINVLGSMGRADLVRRLREELPDNATAEQIEGMGRLATFIPSLLESDEAKKARRQLSKVEQERNRLLGMARKLGAQLPDNATAEQIKAEIKRLTPRKAANKK